MKKYIVVSLLIFFTSFSFAHAQEMPQTSQETFRGKVISVKNEETEDEFGNRLIYQEIEIEVLTSVRAGTLIKATNEISLNVNEYKVGDKVVVMGNIDYLGNEVFYITDYVRTDKLNILLAVFVFLAILVGGKWGVTSLVGMAWSFFVIFKYILPNLINGENPVLIAIIGSFIIIPVTFYLSHGINRKTTTAIVSTFIALTLTGMLSNYFVELTKLTGFASEEASFLFYLKEGAINMKGLLLAGMIIGTLGVMDDITISQASIVQELKLANLKLSKKELIGRAMKVGKDHIASLINTLVLVYTGASLPLLLLFVSSTSSFTDVINMELIADEVVRTLVGSIGLILAVPITTVIAARIFDKENT